jgi:hypothetical protein
MKLIKSLVVVLVAVSVFGMASSVLAAEAGAVKAEKAVKETATVKGVVNVTKDSKDEVTGVELTATDGTVYQIKMNIEGKSLEKENGKNVEAIGIVTEKGGKKVLNVKSHKIVEEKTPAPGK